MLAELTDLLPEQTIGGVEDKGEGIGATAPDPIAVALREERHTDALRHCVRTHGALLARVARALVGSPAEAEDVVQESLLLAYRAFPSFRGEGSVRAFLLTIVRRVAARTLEARDRARAHAADAARDGLHASQPTAERVHLEKALIRLRPSEREALLVRFVGDLSFKEVAEVCGCEEATARQRVTRALHRLRELLGDNDNASDANNANNANNGGAR